MSSAPPHLPRFLARALALFACVLATAAGAEPLVIPGAGPPEAGLRALGAAFSKANPGTRVVVPPSTGIAGGIRAVSKEEAVIGRIARRLKDDEIRSGLKQVVIAADAVVFAVGSQVGVKTLTHAQVLDVFSGRLDDWQALGAERGPIRVLVREPTEIAHQAIRRHVAGFESIAFTEYAKLVNADFEMIESLDRFKTAIGWLTASSLTLSRTPVRAVALDGVAPTPENVASGRYPMAVEHVLIFKEDRLTDLARRFIAFATSEAGREVLRAHGVVPARGR